MTKEEIIQAFEKETGKVWFTSPTRDYVEWLELKLQSENERLKAELPLPPKQSCPQCKAEFTKEELLTNEHCFKCGYEMKGF